MAKSAWGWVLALVVILEGLALTAALSHVSEHTIVAAGIGFGTLLWALPLARTQRSAYPFVVAWWAGTMYYLGREVRDFEKGDSGFDWGGFLGPALGNTVTFAVARQIYEHI